MTLPVQSMIGPQNPVPGTRYASPLNAVQGGHGSAGNLTRSLKPGKNPRIDLPQMPVLPGARKLAAIQNCILPGMKKRANATPIQRSRPIGEDEQQFFQQRYGQGKRLTSDRGGWSNSSTGEYGKLTQEQLQEFNDSYQRRPQVNGITDLSGHAKRLSHDMAQQTLQTGQNYLTDHKQEIQQNVINPMVEGAVSTGSDAITQNVKGKLQPYMDGGKGLYNLVAGTVGTTLQNAGNWMGDAAGNINTSWGETMKNNPLLTGGLGAAGAGLGLYGLYRLLAGNSGSGSQPNVYGSPQWNAQWNNGRNFSGY